MAAQDCQRNKEAWSGERIGPGALASVPVPGMSQKGLLCQPWTPPLVLWRQV